MSSKRSVSVCSRSHSPKFFCESQTQISRLLSSTISNSQISSSKSPLENISYSHENIQGSSALLASELDKQIMINSELSKETSMWKRKYKECFRLLGQHLPTDIDTEVNERYQQKYTKLKGKATDLKKGFKALEKALIEKNQEIGAWREKYNQMEREYIDQIQNLRNQIEVVLKTQIEKEVTIALSQLEKENSSKEENWKALFSKLSESQLELKTSNEERDRVLRQFQEAQEKLYQAENKILDLNDLQKEIKFLNNEQEKTTKQLSQVKDQLSAKEINCQSIQSKYTALNGEIEKLRAFSKEQTTQHENTKKELESLNKEKQKILQQLEQTREQLKAAEKNYKDAQCKFILLSGEAEKLQGKDGKLTKLQEELLSAVKERDIALEQLEDIRAELLVAQDKNARISALEEEISALTEEKENALRKLKEVEVQLLLVEERTTAKDNGIYEIQSQNNLLKIEIENLRRLEEENIAQIKQLLGDKDKLSSQFEQTRTELNVLKENYAGLLGQVDQWRALEKEKSIKLDQLKEENLSLNAQREKAVKQVEQTKGMLSAVEKNYKDIYSNNVLLKTETQNLQETIKDKNTKLIQLEEGLNAKVSEAYAKEIELKSCKDSLVVMNEELQSLRDKIRGLNLELEAFKINQASSEGKTLTYLEELKKRDQVLKTMEAKIQAEESHKTQLEKEVSELKMQIRRKEQEFEASQKDKSQILEQYEKRIQALIERNGLLVTKEGELQLRVEELALRTKEKEELERKINILAQENLSFRNSINVISAEKNEMLKANMSLENKLKEFEASWGQLKAGFEGEKDVGEMLRKLEVYKKEMKRLGCEADAWRKKHEDQELRNIQEIDRIRCEAESVWKKRMDTEIESKNLNMKDKQEQILREKLESERVIKALEMKLQTYVDKTADFELERRTFIEKNEKLSSQVSQLLQEIEASRIKLEEDKQREERLVNAKFELEKEKRIQLEKDLTSQFQEKVSFHEEQAKTWKAKVQDFELRQVMYFIEIERLYAINGELIADVNRLTQELRDTSQELDRNKQMLLLEASKAETYRNQQKDNFDEVAGDLRKQIEGFEKKLQVHFNDKPQKPEIIPPLRMQDLANVTPAKKVDGFGEKKLKKQHMTSLQKSHAELMDLALKFESEKKTMETQLAQFKKLVDINKSEMGRFSKDSLQIRTTHEPCFSEVSNPRSPTVLFDGESARILFEQPQQSHRGSEHLQRSKSAFRSGSISHFPLQCSIGKENSREVLVSPLLPKSATTSSFKNLIIQTDEEPNLTPRITLFK